MFGYKKYYLQCFHFLLKHILICLIFFGTELLVNAQQDPFLTNFGVNHNVINPAYSGSRQTISAMLLNRSQWVGIDGAPKTNMIAIHGPLWKKNIGLGFSYTNDQVGPVKRNNFYADYSYKIRWKRTRTISFGLKAGYDFVSIALDQLENVSPTDIAFQVAAKNNPRLNLGAGVYYKTKKFYASLSMPRLFSNRLDIASRFPNDIRLTQPYWYFLMGREIDLSKWKKGETIFLPTLQWRYAYGAPLSVDVNLNFIFQNRYWIGTSLRTNNIIGLVVQYQFTSSLRAGYSYDFFLWGFQGYSQPSHEIMLIADFGKVSKKRRYIHCPRF